MKYKAVVTVDDALLFDVLAPDLRSAERASINAKKTDSGSVFTVVASDAVALRACLNSLVKGFLVFEKVGKNG